MQGRAFLFFSAVGAAAFWSSAARALTPDDIAVVFNTQSPNSLKVARYYMAARKIPAMHLIPITCDPGEFISEESYRTVVVQQIAKALADRKLDDAATGIKCLVTTYDVPLRIQARVATAAEKEEIAAYRKGLEDVMAGLEQQLSVFNHIAPEHAATAAAGETKPAEIAPPPAPAAGPATAPAKKTWQALVPELNTAANAAATRLDKLAGAQRVAALQEFIHAQQQVAGITGLVNSLRVPDNSPGADAGRKQLNDLSTTLHDLSQQYVALGKKEEDAGNRRQMVAVRTKAEGLVGEAQAMEAVIAYLTPTNTEACLDSELTMVLADQNYNRSNWLNNPKTIDNYTLAERAPAGSLPHTLMVTRLDGPTVDKVIEMIDTSLKIEAGGLDGKIYLDARGLRGTDAYAVFDADLRRAAEWLKTHSTMDVILDDTPALLQAKDCPDAALYCGWYSLNNYQDSCQWVAGAVGYHVASFEMPSLHNPKETGWVPNLLKHGFCGTLGATDEPYLTSFPKPSQFFPLLLSGKFTQGEVWEVTSPMLSWRLGYVGDPLYNPFKAKPRVKVEDIKADSVLKNAFAILGVK